jgi:hypothetical protein
MKNTAENSEQLNRKFAATPAENPRWWNIRGGSIGSATRRSTITNATSAATPAASEPITSPLPQPASLPRISPQTIPSAAMVTSASPRTSNAARGP